MSNILKFPGADKRIVDVSGQPLPEAKPDNGREDADSPALRAEIERAVADKHTQGLGAALICGMQLQSWAVSALMTDDRFSEPARHAITYMLLTSCQAPDGTPAGFSPSAMVTHLRTVVLPYIGPAVKRQVKQYRAAARAAAAATNSDTSAAPGSDAADRSSAAVAVDSKP